MRNKYIIFIIAFLFSFGLDQITKQWVHQTMSEGLHPPISVIPGFMNIIYTVNKGAIFGLFQGSTLAFVLLSSLGVLLLALATLWVAFEPHYKRWIAFKVGLLAGAGAGNLFDRIWHKGVIDFIDFTITISGKKYSWFTFNVADAILVLVALLWLFNWPKDKEPISLPKKS